MTLVKLGLTGILDLLGVGILDKLGILLGVLLGVVLPDDNDELLCTGEGDGELLAILLLV